MFSSRFKTVLEIAAVFAVFFLFGAWMTPDNNETHYVGKAIHYWNPDWIPDDPFLESRDAHWSFYFVFGWLTFFCSPTAMAWIGRIVAWGLLAWSWQRLSYALIPVRWVAIPTALALAYYIESFNMAGEWLIGGIEGKSLAYPFVFFALEAILRQRWNRAGILLGISTALHVLVGGWATLIAGVLFFTCGDWRRRTASPLLGERVRVRGEEDAKEQALTPSLSQKERGFTFPWLGLIVGGATALCGLLPVLMLNDGVSAEVISKANQIYVFERLPHHLVPYLMKDAFLLRFALLTAIWILYCRYLGGGREQRMFNGFIWGTLALAAIGIIIAYSLSGNKELSASLLRFYWFRLSDIAIPMGIAIGATRFCVFNISTTPQEKNNSPLVNTEGLPIRQNGYSPFAKEYTFSPSIPSFQNALSIVLTAAVVYFAVNYFCFSFTIEHPYFVYKGFSPADQNVSWAITLLGCLMLFSYPLSLWERAWVRGGINKKACSPHPNPLPKGEGTKATILVLFYIALAFYAPLTVLPKYADLRTHAAYCRAEPDGPTGKKAGAAVEWIDMCQWVKENTEPTAKFWIPRDEHTFKWHAQRADIGTRKNIPQDAAAIVEWWKSMSELFRYKNAEGANQTDRLLTTLLNNKTDEQIAELRQRYGFDYIICAQSYEMPKHSTLELVYENEIYVLYRVEH